MLWNALVSATGPLDAAIAERAWDAAERARDDAMLATLAGRCDLPAALEQKAAKHKRAAIRAARLARPGWDETELAELIVGERADSALLILAEDERRRTVLNALCDRAERTGSRGLIEALARNTTLDAETAGRVWAALGNFYGDTWRLPTKLMNVNAQMLVRVDAHNELAKRLTKPSWSRVLLGSAHLDDDGAANVVRLFVTDLLQRNPRQAASAAAALARNAHLPAQVRPAVLAAVEKLHQVHVMNAVDVRTLKGCLAQTPQPKPALAPSQLRSMISTDPAELRALANQAAANRDRVLAQQLALNPALDPRGIGAVVATLGAWDSTASVLLTRLAATDVDGFAEVLIERPELLRFVSLRPRERNQCLRTLHQLLVADEHGGERRNAWLLLVANGELTDDQLLDAPWWVLGHADDSQRGRIAAWVAQALGENETGWDLLGAISENDMSVRQLVQTVDALA